MTQFVARINFFGAFRKYGDHATLLLPADGTVESLKSLLAQHLSKTVPEFSDAQLLRDSAIACNDRITAPNDRVGPGETLSILPPVCGG